MNTKNRHTEAGFSLLEAMLAASLLAGAALTIGALSGRSLSAIRIDQQTEKAWQLADAQLKLIDAIGIYTFLQTGVTGGTFDQAPEYSWRVSTAAIADIEGLYGLLMEVFWTSGNGSVRRIACETRLYDPGTEGTTAAPAAGQGGMQGQPAR